MGSGTAGSGHCEPCRTERRDEHDRRYGNHGQQPIDINRSTLHLSDKDTAPVNGESDADGRQRRPDPDRRQRQPDTDRRQRRPDTDRRQRQSDTDQSWFANADKFCAGRSQRFRARGSRSAPETDTSADWTRYRCTTGEAGSELMIVFFPVLRLDDDDAWSCRWTLFVVVFGINGRFYIMA